MDIDLPDVSSLDFLKPDKELDTKIPIPDISYLTKLPSPVAGSDKAALKKYEREYDKYCQWSALPKEERKPKTALEFERKFTLPKGYTNYFRLREDFRSRVMNYFWEWMMDLYPDVVYSMYKLAVHKGNAKAAEIFIDIISKRADMDRPKVTINPLVMVGVPQEKIDKLFIPKDYQEAKLMPTEKK